MGPTMINVGTAGRKDFSIDGTLVGNSDSVLPTEKAVKTYVDNSVVGLLDDRGDCDASVNTFPATGGSGTAGAVLKGDTWRVSVAGTLGGTNVNINDWVRALTDTPGQTSSNWAIMAQFDNSFTDFDASTNPNYPASTKKGQRWKVTVAGKVGGVSGKTVKVGDTFESLMVSTGGTELAVGSEFIILTGYGPFGTMSLQDASNVNITGGAFTGLTGAGFRDTSAAFDVTMGFTSSTALDAGRSITWDVKNSSHQLKFTAASIVTFPAGTNTLLGSAVANTITTNGAASTPALKLTGSLFTGGTGTTTKPLFLLEPTGTTSTGWSTAGTLFGANAPSGFGGRLLDLQKAGVSQFYVDNDSNIYAATQYITLTGGFSIGVYSGSGGGYLSFFNNAPSSGRFSYFDSDAYFSGGYRVLFANSRNDPFDCGLKWGAAGVVKVTDGSTGRGTLDAAGYRVGGVAGVSFSGVATTLTFVNGICTAAS